MDERFATYYGLWLGSIGRGEMGSARETAQTFLREAEAVGRMTEVAAAHRYLGLTCLTQADLIEARAHCEEALRIYDPQRERDAKFRYGTDTSASATAYLANAKWLLGDFGQARELLEEAAVRAVQSSHVPTQVNVCCFNVVFEVFRDDAQASCARREVCSNSAENMEYRSFPASERCSPAGLALDLGSERRALWSFNRR